jgi:protein-S-isoprenylcysteine O-methyltransferase Ste14
LPERELPAVVEGTVRKPAAIAGSALFFILAPGVVAGLLPWLLTHWHRLPLSPFPTFSLFGALPIVAGLAVLVHAFVRFALEGAGTPAPVAPTERLVIGGIYRHVRNPMYVAVLAIILGQALLFGQASLVVYAGIVGMAMFAFVRSYEEPLLASRYGAAYAAYRTAVPGWLPRLTPWRGDADPPPGSAQ